MATSWIAKDDLENFLEKDCIRLRNRLNNFRPNYQKRIIIQSPTIYTSIDFEKFKVEYEVIYDWVKIQVDQIKYFCPSLVVSKVEIIFIRKMDIGDSFFIKVILEDPNL